MTLTGKVVDMVFGNVDGMKQHPVSKKNYVKIPLKRSINYIKFRDYWNKVLKGYEIMVVRNKNNSTPPFIIKFKLGAISKNTKDELTIYFSQGTIVFDK